MTMHHCLLPKCNVESTDRSGKLRKQTVKQESSQHGKQLENLISKWGRRAPSWNYSVPESIQGESYLFPK